ncbi:unnamed protein product [Pleuronectes platessa]|uniref:Uncharacterized protein n=1 Tax=Pleuronectes platessa TaxID=8262 RepID=A0A9N7YK49_PLEPL|nr:unnamed protein product [Pleuronectes platessa]
MACCGVFSISTAPYAAVTSHTCSRKWKRREESLRREEPVCTQRSFSSLQLRVPHVSPAASPVPCPPSPVPCPPNPFCHGYFSVGLAAMIWLPVWDGSSSPWPQKQPELEEVDGPGQTGTAEEDLPGHFSVHGIKKSHKQALKGWKLNGLHCVLSSSESGDTYQRQVLSIFSIASGICLLGVACMALYRRNKRHREKLQAHFSDSRSLRDCSVHGSGIMSKSTPRLQYSLQLQKSCSSHGSSVKGGSAAPGTSTVPPPPLLGRALSKGKRFSISRVCVANTLSFASGNILSQIQVSYSRSVAVATFNEKEN